MRSELVSRTEDCVGESPRWEPLHQCVWWVDNEGATVHRYDLKHGHTDTVRLPRNSSSLALMTGGERFIGTLPDGVYTFSVDGQMVERLAMMDAGEERCSFNDSGCDVSGRLWIGSGTEDERGLGRLWLLRPGAEAPDLLLTGLSLPNGIGFSPDNRVMYLVDSLEHVVHRIPYALDTGALGEPEPFCGCEESIGLPDGLAVDVEGGVWVAFWGGGCVRRYAPDGQLAAEIRLPVAQVAGCAFGGPDLSELYVTTARYGLSATQLAEQPLAGALFRIATDTTGVPVGTVPEPGGEGLLPEHDSDRSRASRASQDGE